MKQREIKFRAWDKEENCFFARAKRFNAMDISITLNGEIIARPNIGEVSSRFILMQFTGLRDKNGVEIYEGDILYSKTWGNNERTKNKYHVVEWGRCGWVASGYNGDINVKPSLDVRSDFEIIGNIHQNPSLL